MIEAMKQALEALELALRSHGVMLLSDPPQDAWKTYGVEGNARQAITSLRQAIAELESQERNFCPRCGKRTNDIHTCTLSQRTEQEEFKPDWDAMAVMVEEQQRMAKRIEELEAMLEKSTEQEPVALTDDEIYDAAFSAYCRGENTRELFRIMLNSRLTCSIGWDRNELKAFARNIEAVCTRPPQRSESSGKPSAWVGLTDEDMDFLFPHGKSVWVQETVKIIEAKLKEKNT